MVGALSWSGRFSVMRRDLRGRILLVEDPVGFGVGSVGRRSWLGSCALGVPERTATTAPRARRGDEDRLVGDDRADGVVEDAAGDDEDDAGVEALARPRSRAGRGRSPGRRSRGRGRGPTGITGSGSPAAPVRVEQAGWRRRRAGTRRAAGPTARPSGGRGRRRPARVRRGRPARSGPPRRRSRRRRRRHRRRRGRRPATRRVAASAPGGPADVMRTTSWVAGVVTPRDAIASMNTPVSSRSLTPGRSSATAAASAALGDLDGGADGVDLLGRLDAPGRSQRGPAVDDLGVGERHRQQLGEQRRHGVGADPARARRRRRCPASTFDEVHRVPRDPVQVVVGDVVGDALVPGAQQVDLPRRAHDHAAGAERAGAGVPQDRHARHVADVGDPPEHEHVEVVRPPSRRTARSRRAVRGARGGRGAAQSP